MKNPYEKPDTAVKIAKCLSSYKLSGSTMKEFFDL
jgi:hypothetical protein